MRLLIVPFILVVTFGCEPSITFSNHLGDRYDRFIEPPPRPLIRPYYLSQEALSASVVRGECIAFSEMRSDPETRALAKRAIATLSTVEVSRIESSSGRQAFWINVYNMAVLQSLSERLQVNLEASVSDGGFELLRTPNLVLGEQAIAPDWIHHGILRGDFSHVALSGVSEEAMAWLQSRHNELDSEIDPKS